MTELYWYAPVCAMQGSIETKVKHCLGNNGLSAAVLSVPHLCSCLAEQRKPFNFKIRYLDLVELPWLGFCQ